MNTGGMFLIANEIINADCITYMRKMEDASVNLTLTDIPYDKVNKSSNGLRTIDKAVANTLTFDLPAFLNEVWRVTRGTIIIFCGKEQFSQIFNFFNQKQEKKLGTARQLIWRKTNPSPMNGEYVYLSGVENAVWFKKRDGGYLMRSVRTLYFLTHVAGASFIRPRRIMNC